MEAVPFFNSNHPVDELRGLQGGILNVPIESRH